MKKRNFILILVLMVASICLCFGCSSAVTRESVAKDHAGEIKVTYDLNAKDASWGGVASRELCHYYKKNGDSAYLADPSKSPFKVTPSKANHFLEGWYKDPECTQKWNFGSDKASSDITLYARWIENFNFKFLYKDGEIWKEVENCVVYVSQGGRFTETQKSRVKREGYTLFELFKDADCSEPWDHTYKHTGYMENGERVKPTEYVYTTWIEGEFSLMSYVADASYISSGNNVYLLNDIDFLGNGELWGNYKTSYGGVIEGNNHTISNITISVPDMLFGYKDAYSGLFGRLLSGAVLRNITFENIVLEIDDKTLSDVSRIIGLLAGEIEEGVTFENVKIIGKIIVKNVNSSSYTLGKVAGEYEAGAYAGLIYDIEVEGQFPGYDVTVDSNDKITVKPKAA